MQGRKRANKSRANFVDGDAGRPGQFAQLVAVGVRDDRDMRVIGGRIAQQLLQPDLALRRVHDIDAAHDFGHALHSVVDDNGQLVSDEAVAAPDNEISRFTFEMLDLLALEPVCKGDWLVVGAQSDGGLRRIATAAAGSGINGAKGAAGRVGKVLARTAAGIGQATGKQRLEGGVVCRPAGALENDVAVPLESISLERVQYALDSA